MKGKQIKHLENPITLDKIPYLKRLTMQVLLQPLVVDVLFVEKLEYILMHKGKVFRIRKPKNKDVILLEQGNKIIISSKRFKNVGIYKNIGFEFEIVKTGEETIS